MNNLLRIFKYPLIIEGGEQAVSMPAHAKILKVGNQHDEVMIWALVDDSEFHEPRYFELLPTGASFKEHPMSIYLDTVVTHGGGLVWHVFERWNK